MSIFCRASTSSLTPPGEGKKDFCFFFYFLFFNETGLLSFLKIPGVLMMKRIVEDAESKVPAVCLGRCGLPEALCRRAAASLCSALWERTPAVAVHPASFIHEDVSKCFTVNIGMRCSKTTAFSCKTEQKKQSFEFWFGFLTCSKILVMTLMWFFPTLSFFYFRNLGYLLKPPEQEREANWKKFRS